MNLSQFFEHWSIVENPFRGEEARNDSIFARMGVHPRGVEAHEEETAIPGELPLMRPSSPSVHSDFDKIIGELDQPSTSIVFGEKGSGKTAIRLQIAGRIAQHNRDHPTRRVFLIPYDDLNKHLDHFKKRSGVKGDKNPFEGMRLVDHMDAMLSVGVGRVLNALLPGPTSPVPASLGEHAGKRARRLPATTRRDLLLLQAVYDSNDPSGARTARLRQMLKINGGGMGLLVLIGLWTGWVPGVALFFWRTLFSGLAGAMGTAIDIGSAALLLLWMVLLVKVFVVDRMMIGRVAAKVAKQLRMVPRAHGGYLGSLRRLNRAVVHANVLPMTDSDEQRYAMFARLQRVIAAFGFTGVLVVIDRVDEPTLVNGDAERMKPIIWPMLNNKFLQLDGVGIKMLLPIELRHALFKESSSFFQEARLDKQNLVERLSWTGAMLYDLCSTRLSVCRPASAERIGLIDLFSEDVTRSDVVEALNYMQQPRDAFKFLYRCFNEHCSTVTADENSWRIAKHTLERVRKDEAERVMQLQRGIRPA